MHVQKFIHRKNKNSKYFRDKIFPIYGIYIHVHTCTYIHTCRYTHRYIHVNTYIHKYIRTVHTCTHIHTMYTHICTLYIHTSANISINWSWSSCTEETASLLSLAAITPKCSSEVSLSCCSLLRLLNACTYRSLHNYHHGYSTHYCSIINKL